MVQGPIGDGEGELNVLAWPGYAESGKNDPKVDWVTPFTDKTGCKVNVKEFGTSDEARQPDALRRVRRGVGRPEMRRCG